MIIKVTSAMLLIILSYLAGSIPFAVITGKVFYRKDIRSEGSGNAGATNVYRVLGAPAAIFVLTADFLKGFLPTFFLPGLVTGFFGDQVFSPEYLVLLEILAVSSAVAGHSFPVFAGFRGGKGVATSAGGITAMFPLVAPFCLAVFVCTVLLTSYASAASLLTAWALPLFYILLSLVGRSRFSYLLLVFFILTAAGITVLHRRNISRLIRGEEKKLRWKGRRE